MTVRTNQKNLSIRILSTPLKRYMETVPITTRRALIQFPMSLNPLNPFLRTHYHKPPRGKDSLRMVINPNVISHYESHLHLIRSDIPCTGYLIEVY